MTLLEIDPMQTDWWERAFAPNGAGWPLVILAGLAIGAWRVAKFLGPLIQQLTAALIGFLGNVNGRTSDIHTTTKETRADIAKLMAAFDSFAAEVRKAFANDRHGREGD